MIQSRSFLLDRSPDPKWPFSSTGNQLKRAVAPNQLSIALPPSRAYVTWRANHPNLMVMVVVHACEQILQLVASSRASTHGFKTLYHAIEDCEYETKMIRATGQSIESVIPNCRSGTMKSGELCHINIKWPIFAGQTTSDWLFIPNDKPYIITISHLFRYTMLRVDAGLCPTLPGV